MNNITAWALGDTAALQGGMGLKAQSESETLSLHLFTLSHQFPENFQNG